MEIGKGRALCWFAQRITGLILSIGVVFHFIMFHYFGYKSGLTFFEARERLISPGWITFYTVLLSMAIFHGMNGLWGVFLDYDLTQGQKKIVKFALYLSGFILFMVGVLILVRFNTLVMAEY